jgi:hypothetical protein
LELIKRLFRVGPRRFDVEAHPFRSRALLAKRNAQQRREFVKRYEKITSLSGISPTLGTLVGGSFKVLGSHPDREGVIVKSQITWINGRAPISGQVQALQAALRKKNASNGIIR